MRTTRRRPATNTDSSPAGPEFEKRIRREATLGDLDLDLAGAFLKASPVGGESVLDSLQHYGLIRPQEDEDDWTVSNAALLLFARAAGRRWHPRAGLRVARVAGTQRLAGNQNVTDAALVHPPLACGIRESLRAAGTHVRRSEALRDIFFRDMPEYPDLAWREIIVNAIAHRDYAIQNQGTEVTFFDDRMEVSSPGGPVPPVTVEALNEGTPVRALRNPVLTRVLTDVGIMKGRGKGFATLRKVMSESSLRVPTVVHRAGLFLVTLHNRPEHAMAGPGWKNVVLSLPVSRDQKRILLARPDGFTHQDYQRLNAVLEEEAKRGVHDLVRKGITTCAFNSEDEMPVYYLTAELDATRWFLEDRVPKLREHFQRDPKLRVAEYRTLFEAAPAHATRELRQLVELGFLREEGRGRGKGYLPLAGLRK
ncbi:MAG: hypothetical protein OXQ94_05005 [Gemmatimonadota bacterium]|nr:hypothetical protein [Gemmatimonadota bacterium]MDE2871033.1 hypothetical protein [Gemmatimonadota bacterium]